MGGKAGAGAFLAEDYIGSALTATLYAYGVFYPVESADPWSLDSRLDEIA